MSIKNKYQLGWNDFFAENYSEFEGLPLIPARICREDKNLYKALSEVGELQLEVSGKFIRNSSTKSDYPTVGDWVVVELFPRENRGVIHDLLPRFSCFSRKAPGSNYVEQNTASNIDTIFLVSGLDNDFNLARIERYLTVASSSGAEPVVILNKADLCNDLEEKIEEIESLKFAVSIYPVSAKVKEGMDAFSPYLQAGRTLAFLGSSGVGKTSLINRLLGHDDLAVQPVREGDSRGRHTTTHRQLFFLPDGSMVIDTPGIRELQIWSDESHLNHSFQDIDDLQLKCRFVDCKHTSEPGCAIKQAMDEGNLDEDRYARYQKLEKEVKFLESKQDGMGRHNEKIKGKKFDKMKKSLQKKRNYF